VLVDQFVLSPGETATRKLTPEREAGAVLVMGLFRKPSAMTWRAVAILPSGKNTRLEFTASDYRIERR
jgi:type VI secretion system VasD/TssJ family lipoprotein